ncbi:MAG: ferritin-like domain-containing protein [Pseudomonadales bacterium]
MSDKPSYLGLLNAIAVGERRGHAVLSAWRETTRDPELKDVLNTVAIREEEHAAAFTKRLCELGFGVRESASPEFEESLAAARSQSSDADKFRSVLGYGKPEDGGGDPLARVFDDPTIDPQTGALLGRFIAEERDSERRLRAACAHVAPAAGPGASKDDDSLLADIAERIDRLSQTLEDLKQLRR